MRPLKKFRILWHTMIDCIPEAQIVETTSAAKARAYGRRLAGERGLRLVEVAPAPDGDSVTAINIEQTAEI